jgi:hypothetical protein
MARDFARFNIAIWQDPDWRMLPAPAQHLYMLLWMHPELSYCGVVDWRPGRLVSMSQGWDTDDVRALARCLEARHFIVTDDVSEEVLLRSWVRFDELLKQPRMAISFANAYAAVSSNTVRGVIIHELQKLRRLSPNLPAWNNPRVLSMLDLPPVDPKERSTPSDPFGDGFAYGFGDRFGPGLGQTQPDVSVPVSVPPTPTPTPPTNSSSCNGTSDAPRKRGCRLPEGWKPDRHVWEAMAKQFPHVDLDAASAKFADYWHAKAGKDAVKLDWNGTWRNWIRSDAERTPAGRAATAAHTNRTKSPPDEILGNPQALAAWYDAQGRKAS